MSGKRASIFGADSDLDVSGFSPKETVTPTVRPEQVRAVSEAANFQSREPPREMPAEPPRREPRRYRTGRNIQLNIKARAGAIEAFYAIADRKGWVLGETRVAKSGWWTAARRMDQTVGTGSGLHLSSLRIVALPLPGVLMSQTSKLPAQEARVLSDGRLPLRRSFGGVRRGHRRMLRERLRTSAY